MSVTAGSDGQLLSVVKSTGLAVAMSCSLVLFCTGIALVPNPFNFRAMSVIGGQMELGEFVLGGLLLALAAGFGTAISCPLGARTRRGS